MQHYAANNQSKHNKDIYHDTIVTYVHASKKKWSYDNTIKYFMIAHAYSASFDLYFSYYPCTYVTTVTSLAS